MSELWTRRRDAPRHRAGWPQGVLATREPGQAALLSSQPRHVTLPPPLPYISSFSVVSLPSSLTTTMGLSVSKLLQGLFGKKEMRTSRMAISSICTHTTRPILHLSSSTCFAHPHLNLHLGAHEPFN